MPVNLVTWHLACFYWRECKHAAALTDMPDFALLDAHFFAHHIEQLRLLTLSKLDSTQQPIGFSGHPQRVLLVYLIGCLGTDKACSFSQF